MDGWMCGWWGVREPWGEAKPRAHFCHTAPGPDKNTWQPRSMRRGVWLASWLLGWVAGLRDG